MSRENPGRPIVGAGAIVHRGAKVLLVRRKYSPHAGMWSLPGGVVELGESLQEAVVREVKEETGLEVRLDGLFDVGSDISHRTKGRPGYHFVLVDYVATPIRGKVVLDDESSGFDWFSHSETRKLRMSRGTRGVLESYFRGKKRLR